MAEPKKPTKKVVAAAPKKKVAASEGGEATTTKKPRKDRPITWQASPEAKSKALKFRVIAAVLWALAIGAEAFAIFWALKQEEVNTALLIGLLVGIGALALGGALLWKKANKLDPASEKDKVRFFIQNQLGLIITVIAFLPLIILIFTNKNMDGKQKALTGGIGIAIALLVGYLAYEPDPASLEQYSEEREIILLLTGEDKVYWTTAGTVYHVCSEVPDVNKESQDNTIHEGSVEQAHDAGKNRIVSYWEREAINYCGYTQEDVDRVNAELQGQETDQNNDGDDTADEEEADEAAA